MRDTAIQSSLSEADIKEIESRGISLSLIARQLEAFKNGPPHLDLDRACTLGDGIREVSKAAESEAVSQFEGARKSGRISKFVPASGAASRMFRSLLAVNNVYHQIDKRMLETDDPEKEKNLGEFKQFIQNLSGLACAPDIRTKLDKNYSESLDDLLSKGEYKKILRAVLDPDGLNYANLPKALIPFHRYRGEIRTALEEHFAEAIEYTRDSEGTCSLHFTVSETFRKRIEQEIESIKRKYSKAGHGFVVGLSVQGSSTDAIAADLEGTPFRDSENNLVFRPGGHGALLENLNAMDGDVVLIKNIDNIVHQSQREAVGSCEKLLGGLLIQLQEKCFQYMDSLDSRSPSDADAEIVEEAVQFCREELCGTPSDFTDKEAATMFLIRHLNRPIRVCGMVKNEGEPGGGPFWVSSPRGEGPSLQIVESSQINLESESQYKILKNSQYFNPVDMACGLRDFRGRKFDLKEYADPNAYFISVKSYQGKPLQAFEYPGLWNGSMADWITVFVEVPVETFAPVKQITDLLGPRHVEKK